MEDLGLLALLICANFSLLDNHPRDRIFPGRVKIKITISLPYATTPGCPLGQVEAVSAAQRQDADKLRQAI